MSSLPHLFLPLDLLAHVTFSPRVVFAVQCLTIRGCSLEGWIFAHSSLPATRLVTWCTFWTVLITARLIPFSAAIYSSYRVVVSTNQTQGRMGQQSVLSIFAFWFLCLRGHSLLILMRFYCVMITDVCVTCGICVVCCGCRSMCNVS